MIWTHGLDDPESSLPTPNILWFCDSVLCLNRKTKEKYFPPTLLRRRHAPKATQRSCVRAGYQPPSSQVPHPVYMSHFLRFSHLWTAHISVHDSGSRRLSYDLVAKYLDNRASKQKTFQCRNLLHPSPRLPQAGSASPNPRSWRACALIFSH